jgi:hypothetical protein
MTGAYTPRPMHDGQAQALTRAILEVDDIERLVERDPAAMDGRRRYRALLRRGLAGDRPEVGWQPAPDGWTLQIRDIGRGSDTGAVADHGHRDSGMTVMPERADQIGDCVDVRSRQDGGTVVRLAIPTGARMGAKENG